MTDSDIDDLDALAGEYVLGTLAGDDRAAFEARLRHDGAATRAVAQWAARMQPMADSVAPSIPPATLWQKIVREVGLPQTTSRRTWITLAAAASIALAALMFSQLLRKPDVIATATLASQGGATAFTVAVLEDRQSLLIRAATVDQVQNQSYELWAVPAGGAPVSLGVVQATGETERAVPADKRALLDIGVTLAVSLEPEGGSTTGAPTGPVMFVGALAASQ